MVFAYECWGNVASFHILQIAYFEWVSWSVKSSKRTQTLNFRLIYILYMVWALYGSIIKGWVLFVCLFKFNCSQNLENNNNIFNSSFIQSIDFSHNWQWSVDEGRTGAVTSLTSSIYRLALAFGFDWGLKTKGKSVDLWRQGRYIQVQ